MKSLPTGPAAYAPCLPLASGVHSDRPVTHLPGPHAALGVAGFSGAIVSVYDLAPCSDISCRSARGSSSLACGSHQLTGHTIHNTEER